MEPKKNERKKNAIEGQAARHAKAPEQPASREMPQSLRVRGSLPIAFLAITFGLIAVFWLALSIVYAIPSGAVAQNARESQEILDSEASGGYYNPQSYVDGHRLDNITVSVMVNEAACGIGEGQNPLTAALENRVYLDENDRAGALEHALAGEHTWTYMRYWHGYLVFLKPLLAVFDVRQLRMICLALFVVALGLACMDLSKRFGSLGVACAVGLLVSEALLGAFDAAAALPLFASNFIALVGMMVILRKRQLPAGFVPLFFYVVGACTVYFDFLDNPLLTLGLPASALVLRFYAEKRAPVDCLKAFAVACVCWGAGYGLLWVAKWLLVAIFTSIDPIADVFDAASFRLGMGAQNAVYDSTPLNAIWANVHELGWLKFVFAADGLAAAALFVAALVRQPGERAHFAMAVVLFGCIAVLPYAWYAVLSNHSIVHVDLIAYRNQVLTLFGFVVAGVVSAWRLQAAELPLDPGDSPGNRS